MDRTQLEEKRDEMKGRLDALRQEIERLTQERELAIANANAHIGAIQMVEQIIATTTE